MAAQTSSVVEAPAANHSISIEIKDAALTKTGLASVITSKPAINDHFKTGQRSRVQNMKLFYRDGAGSRKFCSAST
jgi:hypothetical protein